jgi:hypothetical protein
MTTVTTHAGHDLHGTLGEVPKAAWNRATWGPIMMGVVTAIGLQLVFTALGVAIGVSTLNGDETTREMTTAAAAWWLVTGSIAILAGGMVYGRTSGLPRALQLYLGAVGMWSVIAVFGFIVIWTGMGVAASSPMSMISRDGGFGAGNVMQNSTGAVDAAQPGGTTEMTAMTARAARTASWWSVMGMLIGVVCAVVGACTAVPKVLVEQRRHAV